MRWFEAHNDALEVPEVQSYTTDMLHKWPTSIERLLSAKLLHQCLMSETPSWLFELTTGLIINDDETLYDYNKEGTFLEKFQNWPHAETFDRWSLGTEDNEMMFSTNFLHDMSNNKTWRHLKHLHIHGEYSDDDLLDVLHIANFPHLETLEFAGNTNFTRGGYEAKFLTAKYLPKKIIKQHVHIERDRWDINYECWE